MSHITIAFEVEDVWQTRASMEEMGVEFVSDVEVSSIGEVFTYFRGPDGYLYEIWKPVYRRPRKAPSKSLSGAILL